MTNLSSVAALKRLPIGTKLRLVNCLLGPCDQARELTEVRSKDLVFLTPKGSRSYMSLSGVTVEPTAEGFRILSKGYNSEGDASHGGAETVGTLLAEYVFADGSA